MLDTALVKAQKLVYGAKGRKQPFRNDSREPKIIIVEMRYLNLESTLLYMNVKFCKGTLSRLIHTFKDSAKSMHAMEKL